MNALETPGARSDDPLTSYIAADSITDVKISQTQTAILGALHGKQLTYDELILAVLGRGVRVTPQRIRTSCAALRKAGLVRDAENDGRSMAGHRAKRWEIPDA
ncbi:MAG: hypothetical protein ACTH4Y_08385 [Microbacterium gubbeenense]|uniref:hypothetical protein n=1 Tax=Microbacterium gubbeenense TaxID=159896 RepID=UPI003F997341